MKTLSVSRGMAAPVEAARTVRVDSCDMDGIKAAILAGLVTGLQTPGEISWKTLRGRIRASVRDVALAELVREGRIEHCWWTPPYCPHSRYRAYRLAARPRRQPRTSKAG